MKGLFIITSLVIIVSSVYAQSDSTETPKRNLRSEKGEKIFTVITKTLDSLKLPDEFLFRNSEKIYFDNLLIDSTKYRVDYRKGIVYLRYLFRDEKSHRLEIRYRALPFTFKPEYVRREIVMQSDSSRMSDTLRAAKRVQTGGVKLDDIFEGTSLRKSGSIVRGITVGSNQDLNVNSGLRLQLEGTLADGVEISAALTDENTPIQAEGNTQSLQEFDKVFIEVRTEQAKATIGDFNMALTGTEFANIDRKLQGGKVEGNFSIGDSKSSMSLGFANSRGKFNLNQFNGQDGVQGPYRLTGQNGEPFIIVLAGTERVYVDGQLQTRGQNNDYVIEYSTGELSFQPRRLITAQSRITVDFQYSERQYPRTFLGTKIQESLFGDRINFQATYISETDDDQNPIDISLTDAQRKLIANVGGDRLKASDTTAYAGVDENGNPKGSYAKIDTIINGSATFYYRYVGLGADSAFWNPPFSFAGEGAGNYRRLNIGNYEFVGEGAGNYLPLRFLPLPTSQSVFDLALRARPLPSLSVSLEGALSQNDVNTISILDDSTKKGSAYKISMQFNPKNVHVFDRNIGNFDIQVSQRLTTKRFIYIDRTLPVEYQREYNLVDYSGNSTFSQQTSELIRNASIAYQPSGKIQLLYRFGDVQREEAFQSTRHEADVQLRLDSMTTSSYNAAYTTSQNQQSAEKAKWLRQIGKFDYQLFFGKQVSLVPFVNFELSSKETKSISTDTLRNDSHDITDVTTGFRVPILFGQTLLASYGYRTDKLFDSEKPFGAKLEQASIAKTLSLDYRFLPTETFLAQINFTNRTRAFSTRFKEKGNVDNEALVLRIQTRYTPFRGAIETEWLYDVSTEKSAKLEKIYLNVPLGRGQYIWIDQNKNGLKEFSEYVPLSYTGQIGDDTLQYILRTFPSDQLFPTIDLKTSLRLRLRPIRLLKSRESFTEKTLAAISTETLLRVEEKSTERNLSDIYLLNFSKFQNDSTTISGNFTVQQDLYLFENELTNIRFRFQQRTGQNQFSLGVEKRLFIERSMRFVSRIGYELGLELNLSSTLNQSHTNSASGYSSLGRQFRIEGTSISPDLSYRPIQDVELGLKASLDSRTDNFPTEQAKPSAKAFVNSLQGRGTYSFRGKGRIGAQIERSQLTLKDVLLNDAAYELINGNSEGVTLIWRLDFDYRLSNYITASAGYDGRSLPIGRTIHTARAEVRAVF